MLKLRALLGALTQNAPVEVVSPEDIKKFSQGALAIRHFWGGVL